MSCNNSCGKDNKSKVFKRFTDNSTQPDDNSIQSSETRVSTIPIDSIKINEEYSRLIYQLLKSDYEILKQSIKENGLYTPITINEDGIILDGHHRYKACYELGILDKLRLEVREFDDPLLEKKFIYEINRNRRHLTQFQRIELQYREELIEAELAKKRIAEAGKLGAEKRWNKGDDDNEDKVGTKLYYLIKGGRSKRSIRQRRASKGSCD